ncbi:MAG: hypothetical protein VW397_08715 [Candidatus Margulisiibacteriota bacterium]
MEIELQKCKEGLQFNQGELKGYLVDSVVDDKGYPVKKCASGIFWKYADFNHGAQDQNKLLLETPYRTKYKSTWTTAQFDWFFNETRTNFDVIAHKYVPKKERYAEYISNLRKNISTLETQIKTLKTKMETEQQKLEAIKKTSREKLAEAIVANKVELEKLKTAMSNVVRENLQVIKEVDNSWMDLIASHQFFRDENLVFLRKVLGQAPMVNAYLRNVEKLIQVKSRMQLVALSKGEK